MAALRVAIPRKPLISRPDDGAERLLGTELARAQELERELVPYLERRSPAHLPDCRRPSGQRRSEADGPVWFGSGLTSATRTETKRTP